MGTNVFNAIDVTAAPAGALTFTNVAHDASLSIDYSISTALTYQAADTKGLSDVVTVNLVTPTTTAGITVTSLTMQDANSVGIGTLNFVSNGTAGNVNIITTLIDSGLSQLNVSGVDGLTIGTLNEGTTSGATATAATSFTINNTSSGTVKIGGTAGANGIGAFTDSALGNLTFTGTGNSVITNLYDGTTSNALSISNTGTGTATITTLAGDSSHGNNLTNLTLGSGVALGPDSSSLANYTTSGLQDSSTAGVTINGASDNAHVVLNLTAGAATGNTDTITLGNGNNYIFDASTAGTVNVTVGTGANYITLGSITSGDAATSQYNVTLGTHTPTTALFDLIYVGGTAAVGTTPNLIVTGATGSSTAGDVISFLNTSSASVPAQDTTHTFTSVSNVLLTLVADLGSSAGVEYAVYNNNTYIVESNGAGATNSYTAVELVGTHTINTYSGTYSGTIHGVMVTA